jgi:preprotein translocase subunit SecG
MKRTTTRLLTTLVATGLVLLMTAPMAMASIDHGGVSGQGLYGETDDRVVTNAGFIVIAFFPLLIFVLSMLQWRLDKRRDARKAAAKARTTSSDWQGGW